MTGVAGNPITYNTFSSISNTGTTTLNNALILGNTANTDGGAQITFGRSTDKGFIWKDGTSLYLSANIDAYGAMPNAGRAPAYIKVNANASGGASFDFLASQANGLAATTTQASINSAGRLTIKSIAVGQSMKVG